MPRRSSLGNNSNKRTVSGQQYCRIRKRGCYSSTSSAASSVKKRNYRIKRAVVVGNRGRVSNYPVNTAALAIPSSRMAESIRSPVLTTDKQNKLIRDQTQSSSRRLEAKKINGLVSSRGEENFEVGVGESEVVINRRRRHHHHHTRLLPDQSNCRCRIPIYEKKDGGCRVTAASQKLQVTEYTAAAAAGSGDEEEEEKYGGGAIEVTIHKGEVAETGGRENVRARARTLKEVSNSLKTSKELLKLMLRMWGPEERNSSRLTLISALRVELDRARHQVEHLIHEQRVNLSEMSELLEAERVAWRRRERERVEEAVEVVRRELEIERRMRKRAERLNKQLGKELARERRERELMERKYWKGDGEVENREKEVEMLRLADMLREERVQMKLEEAKYEYEEKNAAVERLRNELEIYLEMKQQQEQQQPTSQRNHQGEDNDEMNSNVDRNKELGDLFRRMQRAGSNFVKGKTEVDGDSEFEKDDVNDDGLSGDSDQLHSIELSMNKLNKKCYDWSCDGDGDDLQAAADSKEEVFKGRRSLCEKIQWESICLPKKAAATVAAISSGTITTERDQIFNKQPLWANSNDDNNGRVSSSSSSSSGASSRGKISRVMNDDDQRLIQQGL